jgi:4-amino-4-deoxy-L-arabinose transferase-like glycosyltransferase
MVTVFAYLSWLVVFGVVIAAPGYVLTETVLRGRVAGPPLNLTRAVLGLACWIGIGFLLCAVQWFRPAILYPIAGALLGAALVVRLRRGIGIRAAFRLPPFRLDESLLAGALTVAFVILLFVNLLPILAADAAAYHLTVPRLYAEHGGFREVPYNVYSNWPLAIELLYGLAMQLKDHRLAQLVHWGFGVLTILAVYRFARQQRGHYAGLLAAVLLLANPVVFVECCVAYVDLAFAFFFFMAFWYVSEYRADPARRRVALLLAGVSGGVLVGIKLTGVAAVLLLAVLCLAPAALRSPGRRRLRDFALLFVLPCAALGLPWLVRSWYYTGNPVYPFLYGVFGGPYWSGELATQLHAWHQSMGMRRGLADYLLLPVRVILLGGPGYAHFDGSINPVWIILLPVAIIGARGRPLVRNGLLLSAAYFVFWAMTSQQMRFLIPILPLLAVAAALPIGAWLDRVRTARRRAVLSTLTALVTVVSFAACAVEGVGNSLRLAEMSRPPTGSAANGAEANVFDFIDRELPPRARIMFLNTNQGFFCRREYIADSFHEASQMADLLRRVDGPDDLMATLRSLGITHILWHEHDWGIAYPPVLRTFLQDPAYACLVHQTPDGADRLYAVRN